MYQDLIGHEISLLDLYKLRDTITAKYRRDGYVLSLALIPAQRITSGIVHLALVEGYVGSVHFEGPYTDSFGILRDYAERIQAARPLRAEVLERYVMLMDDLPGISVHTVLKPTKSGEPGSDLTVAIERKAVGATANIDNRGSSTVGPYQFDAGVDLNDQLGVFDQTSIRGIITPQISELRYIDIAHTEQLGLDGTTLVVGLRRNWSVPGGETRASLVKSDSSTLRTGLAYPLIRSRSETLRLTGDLTLRNSLTTSNSGPQSSDRVRMISLGTSWDVSDAWQGSNLVQFGAHRGFDVLGANIDDKSRQDNALTFTKLTLTAQRVQPLPERFSVLMAFDSQYTPDRLTSAEQFGVGGKVYGRAFDSSDITGDKGASVKAELQYTPDLGIPNLSYSQFFVFSDYGKTWNYVEDHSQTYQYVASAGIGFRIGLGDNLSGTFELAQPVDRKVDTYDHRGMRGFFTLSARY